MSCPSLNALINAVYCPNTRKSKSREKGEEEGGRGEALTTAGFMNHLPEVSPFSLHATEGNGDNKRRASITNCDAKKECDVFLTL